MTTLVVVSSVLGLILSLIALWKWIIPAFKVVANFFREVSTGLAIWNGRGATVDPATGAKIPPVLPLVEALAEIRDTQAEQSALQKQQGEDLSDLTSVVKEVADQQVQLSSLNQLYLNVEGRLTKLEPLVAALLTGSAERAATADAAAQALRMVNDHGAVTIEPPEGD